MLKNWAHFYTLENLLACVKYQEKEISSGLQIKISKKSLKNDLMNINVEGNWFSPLKRRPVLEFSSMLSVIQGSSFIF